MKLPACLCVIAVLASSPAAASSSEGSSSSARDVARAAAIAASYGAITSIYRSAEHNREVGGVANSYHLQGRAIDIARRPGVSHAQIAAALNRAGLKMIESLDEGDHSHFAFGTPNPASQLAAAAFPPPPPVPEKPKYPPVLADQHGTLRIDLPPSQLAQR
jgi:hypothetical protein